MAKSIIDIAVNDDAFKEFSKLFDEYQKHLKDIPGAWEAVGKQLGKNEEAMAGMALAAVQQRAAQREQEDALRQQAAENKRLLDLEEKRRKEIHLIWEDSVKIAKNIASTTLDLFKWVGIGGILGGLVGAGGLWGLDRLANKASDIRRTAQGLGITPGEQQSANIDFGQIVDVNSTLASINAAKADQAKWGWFSALHLNKDKDPAQLLVDLMNKGQALYQGGHRTLQDPLVMAMGYLGMDLTTMRRLGALTKKELAERERAYGIDVTDKGLNPSDADLYAQQMLAAQLQRAEVKILNALIDVLTPLTPDLKELSKAVVKTIESMKDSPGLHKLIKELGDGILWLGDQISSGEFQKSVTNFVTDVADMALGIKNALVWLGFIPKAAGPTTPNSPVNSDPGDYAPTRPGGALNQSIFQIDPLQHGSWGSWAGLRKQQLETARLITKGFQFSLGTAGAEAITTQLWDESSFNPFAKGDWNKAHTHYASYGMGQWSETRRKLYMRMFGHTMESVTNYAQAQSEQLRFALWELTAGPSPYNVGNALRASTDPGKAGIAATAYENPKNESVVAAFRSYDTQVLAALLRRPPVAAVQVHVTNPAGSKVAVTAATLPQ